MFRKIVLTVIVIAMLAVMIAPALANQASDCGATHGAFANQNGNFGWLGGYGGTPGYHDGAVGQDSGATGSNNSGASQSVCQPQ